MNTTETPNTTHVLDHGFVRLVDSMGNDKRIVEAARVSYAGGTKTYRQDKGLINYLLRNEHTSPFEQVELTFHVKTPIFIARQWLRHRTANTNEISGRYSIMTDEFYIPDPQDIRYQSTDNKQGRSDQTLPETLTNNIRQALQDSNTDTYTLYSNMLEDGLTRELARINLPVSLYTEFYWKIDLHNLFSFLRLRMHPHAQHEIRLYANAMAAYAQGIAPLAYEAFEEHILHAKKISRSDVAVLSELLNSAELLERIHALPARQQKRILEAFSLPEPSESLANAAPAD